MAAFQPTFCDARSRGSRMQSVWIYIKDHIWVPFFFLAELAGIFMIPLGLPGIWFQFVGALAVTVITISVGNPHLGWGWTIAILVIAVGGEAVDWLLGNVGIERTQGSRRAAWMSLTFGFFFGLFGFVITIPIWGIGPLIGSVMMSFVGTFVGGILGEYWHQKIQARKRESIEKAQHLKPALRVAMGAVIAKAFGIAAKLWFSIIAFCVALLGIILDFVPGWR